MKSCPKCNGPMPSRDSGNCVGCVMTLVQKAFAAAALCKKLSTENKIQTLPLDKRP